MSWIRNHDVYVDKHNLKLWNKKNIILFSCSEQKWIGKVQSKEHNILMYAISSCFSNGLKQMHLLLPNQDECYVNLFTTFWYVGLNCAMYLTHR